MDAEFSNLKYFEQGLKKNDEWRVLHIQFANLRRLNRRSDSYPRQSMVASKFI
jgi:hypothetical protein